jgi:preprotein translocase subunit SecA
MGEEVMRELERRVILSVLDRKWREHLYEMDYLREGIYLRAYSQRDPLVEYQREGFDMFTAMMDGIKEESVGFLFNLQVEVTEDDGDDEVDHVHDHDHEVVTAPVEAASPIDLAEAQNHSPQFRAPGLERRERPTNLAYSAPSEDGDVEVKAETAVDEYAGVGRNDVCPCGSGKKFKRCHGAPGGASGRAVVGG